MALAAGLHGAVRLSFCRAGKVDQFGATFKVRILVDSDTVRPCRKFSGKVVIDTRFPLKHQGILIQFEGLCTLRYATKFDNRTTFHQARECILSTAKKDIDGYQESPIRQIIVADCPSVTHTIHPGSVTFPFTLEIPGDPHLPAPFKNSFGSLVYRFAVYMKSSNDTNVEVGEKVMRFDGHHNLLDNVEAMKPISIEQFFKKSMFTRKKLVETVFSVHTSGFLPEEHIQFILYAKNPKCIPLQMSVQLLQQFKYDASGRRDSVKRRVVIVASKEKDEYEPQPEVTWVESLRIGESQGPTYNAHSMYSVKYSLQYKVKILDYGTLKGEAPIYIGTTRDPIQVLMNYANTLEIPFQGVGRRGSVSSVRSHSSATTTYSLPPAYSQLSSRRPSLETLPPAYDEVEFEGAQEITFRVPDTMRTDSNEVETPTSASEEHVDTPNSDDE